MNPKRTIKQAAKKKRYPDSEENFTMMVHEENVPVYQADNFSKIKLIHAGIHKKDVDHFKLKAELDYESLAKMLHVTKATLFNRKGKRFDSGLSERLVALTDLYSYGYHVMGSTARFNLWMKTDSVALQGRPLDLADTLYGIGEIRNIIGRMAYGVYS